MRSDRTTVALFVLQSQLAAAQEQFDDKPDESTCLGELTELTFYDVKYGDLPFLGKLQKAGIAYDSCWNIDNEYGAAVENVRFTATGDVIARTVYDSERNPNLNTLMRLIDKPDELRQYILDHKTATEDLSWDNQEEYSKIYLANQLINPT